MLTKIMTLVSIAALALAAFFWSWSANFQVVVQFLVCGAACLVLLRAARAGKYLWAGVFLVIAGLFNPLAPVAFSSSVFIWVALVCLTMFLASAAYLKTGPRLTIASVTNTAPRSESL